MNPSEIAPHFTALRQDAILWKAQYIHSRANTPAEKAAAIDAIAAMIIGIPSVTMQTTYQQEVEQTLKLKKNMVAKAMEQVQKEIDRQKKSRRQMQLTMPEDEEDGGIESEAESKMPKWITKEDEQHWRKHGYFACNKTVNDQPKIGFYSINVRQTEAGPVYTTTEISNFLAKPIMHVYKGDESRHIIEITNGWVTAVKEVQSKLIPSREQLQAAVVTEGSFIIFGNNNQWLRIASDLLKNFPRCVELEDLGFHPAGFFAFSDCIYKPGIGRVAIDRYGIFEAPNGIHQDSRVQKFLLPQQSEAYLQLAGTGGDPFENDRVLVYKQSPVTFQAWAAKVFRVFDIQGTVGIAFCIFTLFRDIVARVTGTSPHLYLFGPPQSGKSVLAEMIYSLFYINRNFFIAYEGTVPAFYTYLTRFINCPAVINEVDANTTDPERLQAFKGAFDLEGREKMNVTNGKANKRSTTIQRINSSLVLVGQHIVTNDDNALLTRSIIEDFLPNDNRTMDDVQAFDDLKQIGKQGITSLLTELLNLRPNFEANFRTLYLQQVGEWINQTSQQGKPLVRRILNNYAILSTCYRILSDHFPLGISHQKFTDYCLQKASQWSAFVSSSDTLSEFWRFISYMFEQGLIVDGWDMEVKNEFKVDLRDGGSQTWDASEKVLYLRLNTVHKVYQSEYRKRYSKDGMSMENLLHYFKSKKYFLGPVKQRWFKRYQNEVTEQPLVGGLYPEQSAKPYKELKPQKTLTSSYAFLYSEIQRQIDGFNLTTGEDDETLNKTEAQAQKNSVWQPVSAWGENGA